MTKKHTKKALLTSVLSLLLCFSMLLGTTFAWFTDTASSTNNIIVAGNLDAGLYYQNDEVTSWTAIDAATNVFKKDTLWEPGHVEVIKLKVTNEGSLALKYQLGINIADETGSVNMAGVPFKLSDFIYYGVTTDEVTTREEALAAVQSTAKLIKDGNTLAGELTPPTATQPSEKTVTLVVYMPEEVGNEANYGKDQAVPSINLGISMFATQLNAEEDSFGSDYDEFAPFPSTDFGAASDEDVVLGGDVQNTSSAVAVTIPEEAADGIYELTVLPVKSETAANGETTVALDISLAVDGNPVAKQAGVTYPIQINVGKELQITKLTHKGEAITVYDYDPATGILSFETDSFSPFEIAYVKISADATKVASADGTTKYYDTFVEAIAALRDGDVVTLRSDLTLTETVVLDKAVTATIDLGGHTVSGQIDILLKLSAGNITLTNGSVKNEHAVATETKYSVYMAGNAVAKITDVEIVTSGVGIFMTENAKITELNATVKSYMNANGYCCFDAVSLIDNARVDKISGGQYETYYAESFIKAWFEDPKHSYSGTESWTINLNDANASIGEIAGGTFLGVMDKANNGTPIHVNNGKVELISGGYFGFVKSGLSNPIRMMYVGANASIDKITGGTFEKGSLSAGYGTGFAEAVDASGYQLVETGETVNVNIQLSTKVTTYTLKVVEVVAK